MAWQTTRSIPSRSRRWLKWASPLRANGGGDIVAELFWPLPSMVVAHYLGVPEEDRTHFYGWTQAIIAADQAEGVVAHDVKTVVEAFTTMMGYFTELIKLRRHVPGDDAISQLAMAGVGADSDITGILSVLAFVFTAVAGGIDTTTGLLGGSVQLLHQRPDQRKLLAENPEEIPDSIDEFLRLTSPVQVKGRIVTRDVTSEIPRSRKVAWFYSSTARPVATNASTVRTPASWMCCGSPATF